MTYYSMLAAWNMDREEESYALQARYEEQGAMAEVLCTEYEGLDYDLALEVLGNVDWDIEEARAALEEAAI